MHTAPQSLADSAPSTSSSSLNLDLPPSQSPADVQELVEEDDALDLFADALSTIFDEHMPAQGDPGRIFTYSPPSSTGLSPLTCRIPPQQVNSLFAHHVWSAGLRMADVLAEGKVKVEGEDVLELGAGAGIPGLMAARMGARRVVLSDYDDPALIANLKSNISLAFPDSSKVEDRLCALGHTWGEEASLQALLAANWASRFSHILLADTLWYSEGHTLLLSSLARLLALTPSARIHVCAGFHSGRSTVRVFLRKARKAGFVMRGRWEEVGVKGERREWGWDVTGRERGRGGDGGAVEAREERVDDEGWEEKEASNERNKWVVEGDLGWSEEALREGRVSS
ncbi:hypothetical protein JCM6882_007746 [Rhodosporidiobolus microsporus]